MADASKKVMNSDPLPNENESLLGSERTNKRRTWLIVLIVALIVLVVALCVLGFIFYTYWSGQKDYDDIADQAFSGQENLDALDPDNIDLSLFVVDWDTLRAINPNVVGWIYVPNTEINYPIAHIDGDDEYYLTHNFSNSSTGQFGADYGCIMLSGVNNGNFSDSVNVIYGHNMSNGSMFALLSKFYDSDTFNEHRTFYLLTPEGNYRLRSFAVNRVHGSDTSIVIPNFETPLELETYVQTRLDNTIVTADPPVPGANMVDQVFAFSTCDGADNSYRYVTFCAVNEFLAIEAIEIQESNNEQDIAEAEQTAEETAS